ncbi:MAG: hypothetical protein OHK0012_13500 [Synechococcales cyanobacterium]
MNSLKGIGIAVLTLATVLHLPLAGDQRALGNPSTLMAVSEIPATAPILHIDPTNGDDSRGNGSTAAPYKTITFALSRANAFTIFQLAPGVYSAETGEVFPLHLKSGMMLRGNEAELGVNHQIVGGGAFISPTLGRQTIAILADTGAELRGISVRNEGRRGYAVWVESSSPRIVSNTFTGNVHDGVFMAGQSGGLVEGNRFYKNGANGISVLGTSAPIIVNNLFQETGFGITIDQKSSPRVENNRVLKNRSGIVVGGTSTPVLRGNWIGENQDAGLVAITQARPDLGSPDLPGNNIFLNNGNFDVNNATRGGIVLLANGNRLNTEVVKGQVDVGTISSQLEFVSSAPEAVGENEVLVASPDTASPAAPLPAIPTLPQAPSTQAANPPVSVPAAVAPTTSQASNPPATRPAVALPAPQAPVTGQSANPPASQPQATIPQATTPQATVPTLPAPANPGPVSVPQPISSQPAPSQPAPAQPQVVAAASQPQERIRVLVTPKTPNDLQELQKRIPGAIEATVNGRSVLVAGLYNTRTQAIQVMDELAAAGFDAIAEVISD